MPEPASADTIPPMVHGVALEPALIWAVGVDTRRDGVVTAHSEDGKRSGSPECSQIGHGSRSGGFVWTAEQVTSATRGIEAQLERALDQIERLSSRGFYAGLFFVVAAVLLILISIL